MVSLKSRLVKNPPYFSIILGNAWAEVRRSGIAYILVDEIKSINMETQLIDLAEKICKPYGQGVR